MPDFKDRRVVIAIGAGLALAAGLVVAVIMASGRSRDSAEAPPASQGGLVVQTGGEEDLKLDPKRPLHCFVDGKLVGDFPLSDCARRNGVAAGALDVGLDPSGALAASNGATRLTPLPPAAVAPAPADTNPASPDAQDQTAEADSAPCWRFGRAGWRRLPVTMSLEACVQLLYGGHCPPPGAPPPYGRWGGDTLRLTPGEVDISDDNRDFHALTEQAPDCSIAPISSPG